MHPDLRPRYIPTPAQEKEILGILIDSSLCPDLDLTERYKLLRFIVSSYFDSNK